MVEKVILDQKSQKLLDNFSVLDFSAMKKKLKLMIEKMDTSKLPSLVEIGKAIETNPMVTQEFCITVYRQIIVLMHGVSEIVKAQAQKKLQHLHSQIERLYELEEIERAKENPDALLEVL